MNAGQLMALVTRADLLEAEAAVVQRERITWAGRAAQLKDYGRAGGSAMDRRLVAEAMAALERQHRGTTVPLVPETAQEQKHG